MRVRETAIKYQTQKKPFTYQDYLNLPQDGSQYQLIEGELIMTPAPKIIHQEVSKALFLKLVDFVEKHQNGKIFYAPCDVYFDEHNVVQPDILFISSKNLNIITEDNIKGAPDLIIEILSPSSAYYDLITKKELYQKFGVKEYWIVDPMRRWMELYHLQKGQFKLTQHLEKTGRLKSNILKGFTLILQDIFQPSQ